MDQPRRIAVLTTSRAEWGHLVWPLRRMMEHPDLEPRLYVAAAHLDPRFGTTIDAVRSDGFEPDAVIECLDPEDSRGGMARTVAMLCESSRADEVAATLPSTGHVKVLHIDHEGATVIEPDSAPDDLDDEAGADGAAPPQG